MVYPEIDKSYTQTRYNVTYKPNRSIKHILIHYTATDASAKNNCKYFSGGNRNASADYFIDKDGSIFQFNADISNYYSWHCGDGRGKYGITNAASIGIEVVSSGEEFTQAQKDSIRSLVLALMSDYNVPESNVVRHYDASRKHCPAPYCGSSENDRKWYELHSYITTEGDWLDMATKEEVAQAVWGYRNGNLESVDAYQILRDARDAVKTGGVASWGYKNPKFEEVDTYQILRDIRDEVVSLRKEIEELKEAK